LFLFQKIFLEKAEVKIYRNFEQCIGTLLRERRNFADTIYFFIENLNKCETDPKVFFSQCHVDAPVILGTKNEAEKK